SIEIGGDLRNRPQRVGALDVELDRCGASAGKEPGQSGRLLSRLDRLRAAERSDDRPRIGRKRAQIAGGDGRLRESGRLGTAEPLDKAVAPGPRATIST